MKVYGYEVSKKVESACIRRMKLKKGFRASDIEEVVHQQFKEMCGSGFKAPPLRITDRLIQRERKAGNIEIANYPYWRAVK